MSIKITVSVWKLLSKCISLRKKEGACARNASANMNPFSSFVFTFQQRAGLIMSMVKLKEVKVKERVRQDERFQRERLKSTDWQRLWWEVATILKNDRQRRLRHTLTDWVGFKVQSRPHIDAFSLPMGRNGIEEEQTGKTGKLQDNINIFHIMFSTHVHLH